MITLGCASNENAPEKSSAYRYSPIIVEILRLSKRRGFED